MESPKFENNLEQGKNIIKLDHEKLQAAGWGRPVVQMFPEAIKLFGIIRHLKEQHVPKEEMRKTAADLFDEFGVQLYDFEDVFTNDVLTQIAAAPAVDALEISANYKTYLITPESTVESLTAEFKKSLKPTKEQKAEEEKRQKQYQEDLEREQDAADEMLKDVGQLDFNNIEAVVDWVYLYNKHCIHGVKQHRNELYEKFAQHGYSPVKNDKIEFMLGEALHDKQRYGEALLGFMLTNLGLFERGTEMRQTIDDWKKGIMKS